MPATQSNDETYHEVCQDLFSWLRDREQCDFPLGTNYAIQFDNLRNNLDEILKDVDRGSILAEVRKSIKAGKTDQDDLIYLTNHGPEHVAQVAQKATDLLRDSACTLSSYEGYLLLTAILFHDIGNIYGRENHEAKAWEIMNTLGAVAGKDTLEKRTVIKIALVHGGKIDGSKDTISYLQKKDDVLGKPVRKRFLAAILRFADELADDYSRASRYMLNADLIPENSQIFHRYSDSLKSVRVVNSEVRLRFDFDSQELHKKYPRNGRQKLLLDEINDRVLKMHRERMYCMRFMRPEIDISRIRVDISIYDYVADMIGNEDNKLGLLKPERVQYSLSEGGYPGCIEKSFLSYCSGEHNRKTGDEIKAFFDKKRSRPNE